MPEDNPLPKATPVRPALRVVEGERTPNVDTMKEFRRLQEEGYVLNWTHRQKADKTTHMVALFLVRQPDAPAAEEAVKKTQRELPQWAGLGILTSARAVIEGWECVCVLLAPEGA